MNWESIDTAPKDGSQVFAWSEKWDCPCFVAWRVNPRLGREFWNDPYENDNYDLETVKAPTHWLPLPKLPNGEYFA